MPDEDRDGGLPTRAVHEAYLDMQRALKQYRQAKDNGNKAAIDSAHGDVQETVLTLYEMLRPHMKNDGSVDDYWEGRLPSYNGDSPPDPEEGRGVLQVQEHRENIGWDKLNHGDDTTIEDLQDMNLRQWHDTLGLNGSQRLAGVLPTDSGIVITAQRYQTGLREMDSWETKYQTKQTRLDGFLSGTTTETQERQRVPMAKLKRAARELSDVAKEIGFLPQSSVPDNDDALPI